MIHGFLQNCQEDYAVLSNWIQSKLSDDFVGNSELARGGSKEDIENRVQLAALRLLAVFAMGIAALCALNIVTFVATIPSQLALYVGLYVLAHDIFIMGQNTTFADFAPQKVKSSFWNFLRGKELSEEEQARKFTHGTFLQPAWMWLYVNRNDIQEKIQDSFNPHSEG